MRDVQKRIMFNIIIIAVIAVGLVFLAHDFFRGSDMRQNIELKSVGSIASAPTKAIQGERTYYVVYEDSSVLSQNIKDGYVKVLDVIKVPYKLSTIEDLAKIDAKEDDTIILIAEKWHDYEAAVDLVLKAANEGASLILGFLPGSDSYFLSQKETFGITDVGKYRLCNSLVVKDDMLLGMKPGDILTHAVTEDSIFDIEVIDRAKVYLADENDVPLYYTLDFGEGMIGVYNGENTYERYYAGIVIGVLGTMSEGIAYPIINAGVVFIDDWPGPIRGENEIINNQYGMDLDGFLRYVWWPDMLVLNSKYGIKYTGQVMLTYNDIQEPPFDIGKAELDVPMYSFGQQVIKNQGEVGLHGYNHQPLWFSDYVSDEYDGYYTPWKSKEDAVEALTYALEQWQNVFPNYKLNSYVPPSNIIDETGIEVVKEVLGTPVIISGLYVGEPPQMPSQDYTIEDEIIYFPRMTAGSFLDDETKLQLELGAGLYGVISHFIHPDDVIDPNRSRGYSWEQLDEEYDRMMAYITERYPYIGFETLTDAANAEIDWSHIAYHVVYGENSITVTNENYIKPYAILFVSDRSITQGSGYSFTKLGDRHYYVELKSSRVEIRYAEGN